MTFDAVSVCVPAYGSGHMLEEALDSALSQTLAPVEVIVCLDPKQGDEVTPQIAQKFADRGHVKLVVNKQRLGWVGNINSALSLVASSHAMVLPHDDVLEPDYLKACVDALHSNPGAVLAYSDIALFDKSSKQFSERSETGGPHERMCAFVRRHKNAVAMRGVFSLRDAKQHKVPVFALGDYLADTLWVAQILAQGSMVRVAEPFYRKRLMAHTAHAAWRNVPLAEANEMWLVHCVELYQLIQRVAPDLLRSRQMRCAFHTRLNRWHPDIVGRQQLPRILPIGFKQAFRTYQKVRKRAQPYGWAT